MISHKLLAALLAGLVVAPTACSKKKSSSTSTSATEVTEAGEDTRFSSAVSNAALAITGLDVIGASASETKSTGLHLAAGDYDADGQRINVYDPAMEALSQAGNIICFFNQAAYLDMINKGSYVAQADMDTCFQNNSSSSGQSSGSTKQLTTLYVDSSRTDDYSPLIVKTWFTMEQEDNGSVMKVIMQVKMVIAEGQSDANPVGIFKLSWEGKVDGQQMMKGFIETKRSTEEGKILLSLVDSSNHGQGSETTTGTAELSYDSVLKEVTGGLVHTSAPVWDNNTPTSQEFGAAFNDGFFLRKNISKSTTACLAKDEYDYSVWRYGLYNATDGSRVERNSGFPITVTSNGSVAYGWAGYWGLWLPPSVTVTDGLTVSKSEHGEAATTYTVKVGPGKLIKKTRQSIPLSDLKDVELQANMDIVAYDGTSFKKVGTQSQNGGVEYISTPTTYDITASSGGSGHAGSANMYSQALGGQVIIPYDASGVPSATAFYYKEENVTATASNLTLNCFQQCLQPGITSAQASGNPWDMNASNSTSPYFVVNWQTYFQNQNISSIKKVYTFDATSMTLKYGGNSVTLADGVTLSGNNSWGLQSGPMVTDSAAASITNPFDVYGAEEYYTWETGSNTWNKFIAIRDANNAAVSFDAPLFLSYTHAAANDRSGLEDGTGAKYYGKKMLLQYQGYGQLQGIPSTSDENNHYAPLFAIKDGTLAGDSSQYKIKALDVEVRMRVKPDASCSALSIASLPTLPSIDSYKAPDLGDQPSGLEGEAPAVVEGVVQ